MKFRLLKKDIPVYSTSQSDEIVRYLQSEDLDGDLYQNLIHDNIERIVIDNKNRLSYSTKGLSYSSMVVLPGRKYRLGFQGTYNPTVLDLESTGFDLEKLAEWIAVGVASCKIDEGLYETYFDGSKWKVVSSEEESDRHATIQTGEESHTFYFKRLWENEERKDIAEIVKPERHGKKRNTTVRV